MKNNVLPNFQDLLLSSSLIRARNAPFCVHIKKKESRNHAKTVIIFYDSSPRNIIFHELSTIRRLDREFGEMNLHEITTWQIEKWKLKRKTTIKRNEAVVGSYWKKNKRTEEEKEVWYVEYDRPDGKKKGRRIVANKAEGEAYLSKIKIPVRPATINRELSLLKHVYAKALQWGNCSENPTREVKSLNGEVKRVRFLLPEKIQRLISNCTDHLKPIVTLAVHTGMRRSEIMGLEWDRIDLERGIITLMDTKNNEKGATSL